MNNVSAFVLNKKKDNLIANFFHQINKDGLCSERTIRLEKFKEFKESLMSCS